VPAVADRGCYVVIVTDPYGRILGFIDRSRYFFFQVAPQLYSRVLNHVAIYYIKSQTQNMRDSYLIDTVKLVITPVVSIIAVQFTPLASFILMLSS
jgi:hypothetical protein